MKKEIKGFIIGVLVTLVMMFGFTTYASGFIKSINAAVNSVTIKVNGIAATSDNFVFEGRTYVQVRDICNMIGKDLQYDSATNTVNINDKGTTVSSAAPTPTPSTGDVSSIVLSMIDRTGSDLKNFTNKKSQATTAFDYINTTYNQKVAAAKATCDANKATLTLAWQQTGASQDSLNAAKLKEDAAYNTFVQQTDDWKAKSLALVQPLLNKYTDLVSQGNSILADLVAAKTIDDVNAIETRLKTIEAHLNDKDL